MPNTPQDFYTLGRRIYPEAPEDLILNLDQDELRGAYGPVTRLDESAVYNSDTLTEDPPRKKDKKPVETETSLWDDLKGYAVMLGIFSGNPVQKELTRRAVNNVDDTINSIKSFPSTMADFGLKIGGYLYSSSADDNSTIDPMYYGYGGQESIGTSKEEWSKRKKKTIDAFEWENEASKDVNEFLGYTPKGTFAEDVIGGFASLTSFAMLGAVHPSLALMGGAFSEAESFGNEVYTANIQKGMNQDEAYENAMVAKAVGFGVGMLEAAPVNNLIGRIASPFATGKAVSEVFKQTDKALFGKIKNLAGTAFKEAAEIEKQTALNMIWQGFKEEGLQEFTQGLVEEIARPSLIKDHKFDLGSVIYQGFIGGITGGGAGGIGAGFNKIANSDEVGALVYKKSILSYLDEQIKEATTSGNESKLRELTTKRADIANSSFNETLNKYKFAKEYLEEKELVDNEIAQIKKNGYSDSSKSQQIKATMESTDLFKEKVKEKTEYYKNNPSKTEEDINNEVHNELIANLKAYDFSLTREEQLGLWKLDNEYYKKANEITQNMVDENLRNIEKTVTDNVDENGNKTGQTINVELKNQKTKEKSNLKVIVDNEGIIQQMADLDGKPVVVPVGMKFNDFIVSPVAKSIFSVAQPSIEKEVKINNEKKAKEDLEKITEIHSNAYSALSQLIVNKTANLSVNDRLHASRIAFQQNPSPESYTNFRIALTEAESEPDLYTKDGEVTQEMIDESLKILEQKDYKDYKNVPKHWTPIGTDPVEIIRTAQTFNSISYESMNLPVDINSLFEEDDNLLKSEGNFDELAEKRREFNNAIRELSKNYPIITENYEDAFNKAVEINYAYRNYYQRSDELVKVIETEDGTFRVVYVSDSAKTQTRSIIDLFEGLKITFQGMNTQFTFLEGLSYMKIWYYANNSTLANSKEIKKVFKQVQEGKIKPNEAGKYLVTNNLVNLEQWNNISFSVIQNYTNLWKSKISTSQLANVELQNTTNNSDVGLALYFLTNPDYSIESKNKKTLYYLNNIEMQNFAEVMPIKNEQGQIEERMIRAQSLYHGLATYLSFYYPEIDRNKIKDMSFNEARSLVLSKNISILPQSIAEKIYRVYNELDWNYLNINEQTFGVTTDYFKLILELVNEFKKIDGYTEEITHQGTVYYSSSQKMEVLALRAKFPDVFKTKQVILREGNQSQSLYDILLEKKVVTRKIIVGSKDEVNTETQFVVNDFSDIETLFNSFIEPNSDSNFIFTVYENILEEDGDQQLFDLIKEYYPQVKIEYVSQEMNKNERIEDFALTNDQQKGLSRLNSFMNGDEKIISLRGSAGTGKTTLMKFFLRNNPDSDFLFVSPTHKALRIGAGVLREYKDRLDYATLAQVLGTIGETNEIVVTEKTISGDVKFTRNAEGSRYRESNFSAMIVDEASMINDEQYQLLLRDYPDMKIIFIGDPNQLKGVNSNNNNLPFVNHENIVLNEITRQGSNSPIISLAQQVLKDQYKLSRESKKTSTGEVVYLEKTDFIEQAANDIANDKDTVVLAQTNKTCEYLNNQIRERLFGKDLDTYVVGDKLITTNKITATLIDENGDEIDKTEIPNGVFLKVTEVKKENKDFRINFTNYNIPNNYKKSPFQFNLDITMLTVVDENGTEYHIPATDRVDSLRTEILRQYGNMGENSPIFNSMLYDVSTIIQLNPVRLNANSQNKWLRGYAITIDKSQGSTFDNAYVFEEELDYFASGYNQPFETYGKPNKLTEDQRKRYRYTAFTRARNKLAIYHRQGNTKEGLNITEDNSRFVYPDYDLMSTEEIFKSEGYNDFELDDMVNAEMREQYAEEYGYVPEYEEFESSVTDFESANSFDTVILIGDKIPNNISYKQVIKREQYDYKLHPNTVVIYSGNLSSSEQYFIDSTPLTVMEANRLESYVETNKDVLEKIKVKPSGIGYKSRTKENANNSDVTVSFYNLAKTFGEKLTRQESKNIFNVNLNTLTSDEQIDEFADQLLWSLVNDIATKKIKDKIVINIAGNGISNLFITQEKADELVARMMDRVLQGLVQEANVTLPITIRSGMQTGIDEAGIKWALSRGVNIEAYIPANYLTTKTKTNYFGFFDRFASKPSNSPIVPQTTQEATSIPSQEKESITLTKEIYDWWFLYNKKIRETSDKIDKNTPILDYNILAQIFGLRLLQTVGEPIPLSNEATFQEKIKYQALISNLNDALEKLRFPIEYWKNHLTKDEYVLLLETKKLANRQEKTNMQVSLFNGTEENYNYFVEDFALRKQININSIKIFSRIANEIGLSITETNVERATPEAVKAYKDRFPILSSQKPLQSTNAGKTTKTTTQVEIVPQRAFNEAEAISYFNEKDESISEFGDWVLSVAKGYSVQVVGKEHSVRGMKLGNDKAFYDHKTKTIYINEDVVKGKKAQYKEFVHEVTHHVLIPMLDNNPEFYQAVLALGTQAYNLARNTESYKNNQHEFDKVFKYLKEGKNRIFVNEFVAHVMSNTSLLNQWMKETPFDEKDSIYTKALKVFLHFFKKFHDVFKKNPSLYNQLENVLGYYAGYTKTKDVMEMKGITSEAEKNNPLFMPLSSVLLPDTAFTPVSLVPIGRAIANTNNVLTADYISYLQGLSKQKLIEGIKNTPDLYSSFEALLQREELNMSLDNYIKLKVTSLYNLLQNSREAKVYRLTHHAVNGWSKTLLPVYYTNLKGTKDSSYRETRRIDKGVKKVLKEFGLIGDFVYLDQIEVISASGEMTPKDVIGYKKNDYYINEIEKMNPSLKEEDDTENSKEPFHLYLSNFGALNTVGMVEIVFDKAKINAMEKALRQKYAKVADKLSLSSLVRLAIEDERFNNLPSMPESRILQEDATKVFKRHYDVSPELSPVLTYQERHDIYSTLPNKIGISYDGKDIYFNAFIFDSKNSDMEMEVTVAGKKIKFNMRDVLLNEFGSETTDGNILYLEGGYDIVHQQAFGVEKDGVIKAWASNIGDMKPLFLKASYQKVPMSNDLISIWMKQNNIALLISSSAAKVNDYGVNDIALLEKGESIGKTIQLPLKMFNRQGEKETAYEDGVGLSTGLIRNIYTQYNPVFGNNDFNELIVNVLNRTVKDLNRNLVKINGANLIDYLSNSIREESFSNMELTVSKMILSVLQSKSIVSSLDYEMMTELEKTEQDIQKRELFEELGNIFHDPFFAQLIQDYIRRSVQDFIGFNLPSKWAVLRPDLGFLMADSLIDKVWKNCKSTYENKEQAEKEFWKIIDEKSGRLKDDWMYLSDTMAKQTTEGLEYKETKVNYETVQQHIKELESFEQPVLLKRMFDNLESLGETEVVYEGYNKIVHGIPVSSASISVLNDILERTFSRVGYIVKENGEKRLVALTDKNRPMEIHDKDIKKFLVSYFSHSMEKRTEEKKEISHASLNKKSFGKRYIITAVPTDSPHSQQQGRIAATSDKIDSSAVVLNSDHWQTKAGKDFDIDAALLTYYTAIWGKEWEQILDGMDEIGKKHTSESIKAMKKVLGRNVTERDLYNKDIQIEFMQKLFGAVDNTKLNDFAKMNDLLDLFPKTVGTLIRNKAMYSAYSALGIKANAVYRYKDAPQEIKKVLKKIGIESFYFEFNYDSSTEDVGVTATMYQRWLNDQVDKPSSENGLHYIVTPEGLQAVQYNQKDVMTQIVAYKAMVQNAFNNKFINEKEYFKAKQFFDSIVNTSVVWNEFLFNCAFGARKKYHRFDNSKTKDFTDTMVEIQQQQLINKMMDEGDNEGLINYGMVYAEQSAMYKMGASHIPEILEQLFESMTTNQKTKDIPFLALFNKIDFNLIPQMKTGVWEYKNWVKNYKKTRLNRMLARINFKRGQQSVSGTELLYEVNEIALKDAKVFDKDYELDMKYFVATKFLDFMGLSEEEISKKLLNFDIYVETQKLHEAVVDVLSWINLHTMSSSFNNYWDNFEDQYYKLSMKWARLKNPSHAPKYDPKRATDLSYLDEFDHAYIKKLPTLFRLVSGQDQLVMSNTDFRKLGKNIGSALQGRLNAEGQFKGFLSTSYKSLNGEKIVFEPKNNNIEIRVALADGTIVTFPTIKSLFNEENELSQHIISEIDRICEFANQKPIKGDRSSGFSERNIAQMEAFQLYSMINWKQTIPLSARINEAVEVIQNMPFTTEREKIQTSYALLSLLTYPRNKNLAREFRTGTRNDLDYNRSAFGEYPNNQLFWELISKANPELASKYMNTLSKEYPYGKFFEKIKLQQPYKDEMYNDDEFIWKSEGEPTDEDLKNLERAIEDSDSFDIDPKYNIWRSLRRIVWKHDELSVDSYDPLTSVETIPFLEKGNIKTITAIETFNSVTKSGVSDRVPKLTRGMILYASIEKWIGEMRYASIQKENEMISEYNLIQENFIKTLSFNKKAKRKALNASVYDTLLNRLNRIDIKVVNGEIIYEIKNQKFEAFERTNDRRKAIELAFPDYKVEDKLKAILALNIKTRLFGDDVKYIESMIEYLKQVLDTYKAGETYNLIMDHLLPKYEFMLKAKQNLQMPIYMKLNDLRKILNETLQNPNDYKQRKEVEKQLRFLEEYTAKNKSEFIPLHQLGIFETFYRQALMDSVPFEKNILAIMQLEQGHFFSALHNDMTYLIYRKFVENETTNAEISGEEIDKDYLGQVKAGIRLVSNHKLLNAKPIAKSDIQVGDEIIFLYSINKEVVIKGEKVAFPLQRTIKGEVIKKENGRIWIRKPAKTFVGQRQIEGRRYFVPEGQEYDWNDVKQHAMDVYSKLAEGADYNITEGQSAFISDLIEDGFIDENNLEIIYKKGLSNLSFQEANAIINQGYLAKLDYKGSVEGYLESEFSMPDSTEVEFNNERTEIVEKKTLSDRVLLVNRPSRQSEVVRNLSTMISIGMSTIFLGGIRPGFNNWYDGSTQLFNNLALYQWIRAGYDYRFKGGKTAMKLAKAGKGDIKKFQEILSSDLNRMTATEQELVESYTYEYILKHNLVTQVDNMDIFKETNSVVVETTGKVARFFLTPFTKAEAAIRIKGAFYFSYKAVVLDKIRDKESILSAIDAGVSFTQSLYESLYRRTIEGNSIAKMMFTFGQYGFYQKEQLMMDWDVAKLMGDKFELRKFIKSLVMGQSSINPNRINAFYQRLVYDYIWMATFGTFFPGMRHGSAVNKTAIYGLRMLGSLWLSYLYDDDDKFEYTDFLFAIASMFGGAGFTIGANFIKAFIEGQFSEAVKEKLPLTPEQRAKMNKNEIAVYEKELKLQEEEKRSKEPIRGADRGGVYGLPVPQVWKEATAVLQLLGINESEYTEKQHEKYTKKGKKLPEFNWIVELGKESNYLVKTLSGYTFLGVDNKYLKRKARGMANRSFPDRVEWALENPLEYVLSPVLTDYTNPKFVDEVLLKKDTPKKRGR